MPSNNTANRPTIEVKCLHGERLVAARFDIEASDIRSIKLLFYKPNRRERKEMVFEAERHANYKKPG